MVKHYPVCSYMKQFVCETEILDGHLACQRCITNVSLIIKPFISHFKADIQFRMFSAYRAKSLMPGVVGTLFKSTCGKNTNSYFQVF